MAIQIHQGVVVDYTNEGWSEFRKWVDGTYAQLRLVWSDDGATYFVVAIDDPVYRTVSLLKEDAADFEANFQGVSNKQVSPLVQADGALDIVQVGRLGAEVIYATHNFCDPTTWYSESLRITYAGLTDSGNGLTFTSGHPNWIDMTHGKVMDEDAVAEESAPTHKYGVSIKVNGVVKAQRAPFATEGGDYTVDYVTGSVTFFESQAGQSVQASYSYANGSTWILRPSAGKQLKIEQAEAQFSENLVMNDTIRFGAWGLADVFAPQLVPSPLPPGTLIELQTTRYSRLDQIIDEALGSYPVVPAIGGTSRGNSTARYGFPFRYGSVRVLTSAAGMELRVRLESNMAYGGDRATATFYCSSEKV